MMGKLVVLALLLLSGLPAPAQDTPGTLLWEVTKAGENRRSYLFGTFHEVTPAFFASLSVAGQKLDSSSLLFVETLDTGSQSLTSEALTGWNEARWNELLSPAQQETFQTFAKKSGNFSLYRFSPSIVFLGLFRIYAQNYCDTVDRDSDELMDSYITRFFLRQNKTVLALDENQEEVLTRAVTGDSALREAPYARYCINFMNLMLKADDSECRLINEYKSLRLDYGLNKELKGMDNLFGERNRKWSKKLDEAFKKQNCFVAVGFRHLFYKHGLIQQLRALGYTVVPVPVN